MTTLSKSDAAILRRQIKRAAALEYLACRQGADSHQWERRQPDFEPEVGLAAAWQCNRCLAIKRQVHSKGGELLASDYEYPDGYLYRSTEKDSKMERLFTPQAIRAAYNERIAGVDLPPMTSIRPSLE